MAMSSPSLLDANRDHQHELIRQLFKTHGRAYLEQHPCDRQTRQAFNDIISCRTELQGGHLLKCDHCDAIHYHYHSCHNRHCPICQQLDELVYQEQLKQILLPTRHYEMTIKLPGCLYSLALAYKQLIYSSHMKAVNQMVKAADKLNGFRSGSVQILHTWDAQDNFFVHSHLLMTCGGISFQQESWIQCDRAAPLELSRLNELYLKFLAAQLRQIPASELGKTPLAMMVLTRRVQQAKHKVWCQTVDQHLVQAVDYFGKFRFSVGLKLPQLKVLSEDLLELDTGRGYRVQLQPAELIKRFAKHILPYKFQKVRNCGLYSNASRKNLPKIREIAESTMIKVDLPYIPVKKKDSVPEKIAKITGRDPLVCPSCKIGKLQCMATKEKGYRARRLEWVNPHHWLPTAFAWVQQKKVELLQLFSNDS
jgi:hypothetical protein